MELRKKKIICYAAASLSLQMQQISLCLSNPNNLSIKFHTSLLDWYLNQRIKTESKMYMAYGWPQVIPLEQGLCPSSQKHIIYFKVINRLFLVVSPSHLELWSSSQVFSHLHGVYDHIHVLVFLWLWKTRVLYLWIFVRFCDYLQHKVRLGKYKRNAESLEREGENLLAVWRPDTKLIAILVSNFFFFLHFDFFYVYYCIIYGKFWLFSCNIFTYIYTYYTICKCMYMVLVESHFRNNVVHVSTFVKILLKLEDRQVSRVSLAS